MTRPSVGEWVIVGVFMVVFAAVYCEGARVDCEARTCARCKLVLGLLDTVKQFGNKALDKV